MNKKLITALLITIICMTIFPTSVAFAEEPLPVFYKIKSEDVRFHIYNSKDDDMLYQFIIPETYFVMADLSSADKEVAGINYKPVIYNGKKGYVLEAAFSNGSVTAPSDTDIKRLDKTNYYYKKSVVLKAAYKDIPKNTELAFYGKKGSDYVFYYNNAFTAIPSSEENIRYFDAFTIPDHTFASGNTPPVIDNGESLNPYNKLLTIILIIGITIPAIIIVLLIFKPVKTSKKRNDYYDGDYYEDYKSKYRAKKKK